MSLRAEHIRKSMVDYNSILEIYRNAFPKVEQKPDENAENNGQRVRRIEFF